MLVAFGGVKCLLLCGVLVAWWSEGVLVAWWSEGELVGFVE